LIDTHCHLDFPDFDQDRDAVLERAREAGIECVINIGSSLSGSRRSVELAQRYRNIYASVGVHPHEADRYTAETERELVALSSAAKVVAIGEIGLDYYKNYSQHDNQRKVFSALIGVAKEKNLPLVIHTREAQEDTLRMLKEAMPLTAVVHCFSGNADFLEQCLALGFYISFTCNITYKKADALRALVKLAPLERMLLETDAPYLSPDGFRGKRNEPSFVLRLTEEVGRLKDVDKEVVARVTTENAYAFFRLEQ
jgi:TatD DNase family protein